MRIGMVKLGVRWKTKSSPHLGPISWMIWMPVEPQPISPTRRGAAFSAPSARDGKIEGAASAEPARAEVFRKSRRVIAAGVGVCIASYLLRGLYSDPGACATKECACRHQA